MNSKLLRESMNILEAAPPPPSVITTVDEFKNYLHFYGYSGTYLLVGYWTDMLSNLISSPTELFKKEQESIVLHIWNVNSKKISAYFGLPREEQGRDIYNQVKNGTLSFRRILLYAAINDIDWKESMRKYATDNLQGSEKHALKIFNTWKSLPDKERELASKIRGFKKFLAACRNYYEFS